MTCRFGGSNIGVLKDMVESGFLGRLRCSPVSVLFQDFNAASSLMHTLLLRHAHSHLPAHSHPPSCTLNTHTHHSPSCTLPLSLLHTPTPILLVDTPHPLSPLTHSLSHTPTLPVTHSHPPYHILTPSYHTLSLPPYHTLPFSPYHTLPHPPYCTLPPSLLHTPIPTLFMPVPPPQVARTARVAMSTVEGKARARQSTKKQSSCWKNTGSLSKEGW